MYTRPDAGLPEACRRPVSGQGAPAPHLLNSKARTEKMSGQRDRHELALQLAENIGLDVMVAAVATVVLTGDKTIDCMVMTMSPGLDKNPVDVTAVAALCGKMVAKVPALGGRLGTTGTSIDALKLRAWLGQLVGLRDSCSAAGVAALMPEALKVCA